MNPKEVAQLLKGSRRLFILTGAGTSAASQVPSLFSPALGPNKETPLALLSSVMLKSRPTKLWTYISSYRNFILRAKPNPAHVAIAQISNLMAKSGAQCHIATHSIDGIINEAMFGPTQIPSSGIETKLLKHQGLTELCGNINYMRCECSPSVVYKVPAKTGSAPHCGRCGKAMRPHVQFFDEGPSEEFYGTMSAIERALDADCMLIVGSRLGSFVPRSIVDDHLSERRLAINVNIENVGTWRKNNVVSVAAPCEVFLPEVADHLAASLLPQK